VRQRPFVQEVAATKPGVRMFVVHSEERASFEMTQRVKAIERVRIKLEALQRRVAKGRLKAAAKIGAAAARFLAGKSRSSLLRLGPPGWRLPLLRTPRPSFARAGPRRQVRLQTKEPNLSAVDAMRGKPAGDQLC
jgi:hypothetical protein